jgi:Zinc knuckle
MSQPGAFFLLQNVLMGRFYSDQFFVKTLLYSMHIGFCRILESGITTCIQARDPNKPLPRALTPGQILQTMVDIGNEHCMSTLTTMSSQDLSACCVTQVVHQVAGSDTSDSDASSVGDDSPSDLQFLVRALQGCLCYNCKSPDHIIRACPTASDEDKKHFPKNTHSLQSCPKA